MHQSELPPFGRSWKNMYLIVLIWHAIVVIALTIFSGWY